jgi:hypothetical protein
MDWPLLAALHAVPTLGMTGLIWFVQVVHYPLFAAVGGAESVAYERAHCRRTSLVVLPLMLAELALALVVWWAAPGPLAPLASVGLAALAVVWLSTFALQVPCHRRLSQGPDPATLRRLVATNWLRTAAWTARGAVAVLLLPR